MEAIGARGDLPLGVFVYLCSALPWVWWYLVDRPEEIWQVDLEVYREGAQSLLVGRPVYDWLTTGPQFLPFTYPPFAALMGVPLALVPFTVAGWAWTALQLALDWYAVGVAFGPVLARWPRHRRLLQGVLAAAVLQTLPVSDGIRFGQVNAVVVALCLGDLGRRAVGRWPLGTFIGVATAVKLTPGVFMLHFAAARRWGALAGAVGAAAFVTLAAAFAVPSASAAYWFDAVLSSDRLGPNSGASNQSLRAVLLRTPLEGTVWLTLVWSVLAAALLWWGLRLAGRLHRQGHGVAVVAVCGLVAFLVSPVSWVHHLHWCIVVLGVLLGDARDRRRVVAAAVMLVLVWLRLPWWGATFLALYHDWRVAVGGLFETGYTLWALGALVLLARLVPAAETSGVLAPAAPGTAPDAPAAATPAGVRGDGPGTGDGPTGATTSGATGDDAQG